MVSTGLPLPLIVVNHCQTKLILRILRAGGNEVRKLTFCVFELSAFQLDRKFKETHQDYKTDEDDIFIPYRTFKENVAEALKEAMPCALEKHNQEVLAKLECPPCDTLACADHLTDE